MYQHLQPPSLITTVLQTQNSLEQIRSKVTVTKRVTKNPWTGFQALPMICRVNTHGNGSINSVEKDLTPSIIFNMSEEEFDSAIEDIQDDTGAVRMCLSSKAQQILKMSGEEFDSAMEDVNEVISGDSGAVKKVCPSSGSTRGGGEFSIILNQQLQNEEEDFVADFEDVRNVLLTVENCFTLTGVTPAYHREGCVLVMVRSASGTWLGSATYTYVNPNKKEELRKVVEDKNKWKEILDTMSNGQIGNLDQQEIPSGAVVHGKTRDSWSIKLLTLLIYQAAEVDGFDFLEVVFSTSAGRVTFNNYKDNAIRPEDVARAYGHAILGDFLENVNKRLSKEVGNEDNNETINWLELKKTMETEGNPPRTNDAQPAGHLPRNDSYSDYDADDETSPLPSPSDTEANVDEMHGDLSFYKFSVWESSSQENDIHCMEIDGSDNQHEGNSPSLRNGETDSNRDFCENHLYCTIRIGADSASQQKKEKKRRKKQGIESRNEESPTQSEDIIRKCNALLNFGGGVLEMKIADPQSKGASKKDPVDCFWQTIEGQLKTMIRPSKYDDVFDRRVFSDKILLFVNAPKHLCTMKYNLFVSGDSGVDDANYDDVVGFLKLESDSHKRNLKSNIQVPLQDLPPIPCTFFHQKVISLMECKQVQFKDFASDSLLFSHPKQRFSIARQLSAFGNCDGGVLLIGVRDDRRVSGVDMVKNKKEHVEECVSSLVDKMCCNFKLQRGIHWDLTFSDVSGSESKSVIVVKMAGMRDAGGIFGKCPESYILQCDEDGQQVPHQLDFDKWKGRMKSDDAHLTGNTRGMIDMLSRFQQMRVSEGHLLTVRGDVQRIRDAFFKGDDTFLVSPEGVESSLPAEAQAVIRNIQKVCRRDRFRGFLAVSRSWLRDTGGTAVDSVICDVLLVSRNMGGLHLYTLCDAADETSFQYSKEAAQSIKKRLSENGARGQKFYVSSHVLPCRAGREVKFPSPDDRYPKSYDLLSPRGKLNEILKAMVVTLAAVPSTLSCKLGVTFFNLLTTEQFRLVHQQIEVNRELWIKGVAGTGKTLVAVEFMRELRRREKLQRNEILYVCENEGIASQVRKTDLCNAICRVTFIYG
ncbi:schlafen family member 11-like isoform X3 [Stylophora pistillata]|uniref:schlafen family member 11-like isoform X3 n=1 Tax=Stylophora pistillata TaxID=50429 RepID=UPI000C0527DB|nr:schlafen family member 11-like isoform X3 [Stylophora pistillata]